MHFPAFSYASFPILSDTTQIQKETLEEYQIRIKKQDVLTNKNSEIYEDSKTLKKSKSIFQKVLLIIFVLFLLFILLILVAIANLDLSNFVRLGTSSCSLPQLLLIISA